MEKTTHQPKLVLAVDINLCGIGLCYKEFSGDVKNWIMLYCDTTNSRAVQKCLKSYTQTNAIVPDTIIVEAIYFSPIKDITKLFNAEGVVRGVLATMFEDSFILVTPSVSYKTHFNLATGNHKSNKNAVVEYLIKPLTEWFGKFDKDDNRMHDMADCLLLCMFLEQTWASWTDQ